MTETPLDVERLADLEWLVWFARKRKGTRAEIVQWAIEQCPGLREYAALTQPSPEPLDMRGCDANAAVLVVDAVAAERERIAAAVEGLDNPWPDGARGEKGDGWDEARAAVLAIVKEPL